MDGGMSAKENREERRRWKAEIEEQRRRMDAGKNPMKELERIFIKDIVIGRRLRTINPDRVEELKQSIAAMGLRTPITVRYDYDGDYWRLVAGLHRLEACKALGFEKIRAFILECEDEKTARLWEIAENLHRAELTALERDEHINEWRKLTLEREAANAQVAHLDKPHERGRPNRGHSATAAAFGLSRRDVERAEKVAEDLTTEAKVAARDLHLEDNRSALLKAAKEPTPEAQVQALHDHVEERAQKRATKAAPVTTVETPPVPPPSQADPPPLLNGRVASMGWSRRSVILYGRHCARWPPRIERRTSRR